jgi:hypothetical protein
MLTGPRARSVNEAAGRKKESDFGWPVALLIIGGGPAAFGKA